MPSTENPTSSPEPADPQAIVAARCQEIQSCLGAMEVPEFESIPMIGMAVRLSLHINGLPLIDYEVLKRVCVAMLGIPRLAVDQIVRLLAEIEFVRLQQEGSTIKGVLPDIPFLDEVYEGVGEYVANSTRFNEAEQLALAVVERLAASPHNKDSLRNKLGADTKLFERSLAIGKEGSYLVPHRVRGTDVIVSPVYFAENGDLFADQVAKVGAKSVSTLLDAVRAAQGWPLKLIEENAKINQTPVDANQVGLLKRLASDGAIKPPFLKTTYSGENHFMFTPTPAMASLRTPAKRVIYENAMAIVSAIRLGQLLPERYAIRNPAAVLFKLRTELRLKKATTEFTQQYSSLTHLRIIRLIPVGGNYTQVHVIDTPENRASLDIAYQLVTDGQATGLEIDEDARRALQSNQDYVDSIIGASQLRRRESVALAPEDKEKFEQLLLSY